MENSDGDKILPALDKGNKEKHLTESLPPENDVDEEHQSDSESDSDSNETDSSDSSDSDAEYVCTVCDKTFSGYIPLKQHEKGSKHKKALTRKKKMKKLLNKEGEDDDDQEGEEYLIQEPFAVCKTCDKQFSGPESYALHLKSKTHKQKVVEASILQQVKENGEINVEKLKELYIQKKSALKKSPLRLGKVPDNTEAAEGCEDFETGEYECKTCEKAFSGLVPFTQHLVSKTHAKQIEKKELMRKVVPEPSTSDKSSDDVITVLGIEDDILVCKACSTSFSGPENAASHLKSQKHKKKMEKYLRKLEKKKNKAIELKEIKASASKSKRNYVVREEVSEDSSSEESDAPTSTFSEEPGVTEKSGSETKSYEEKSLEKIMAEQREVYKTALKSLQKLENSE